MIANLLNAGKKIGVTSNSRKAGIYVASLSLDLVTRLSSKLTSQN